MGSLDATIKRLIAEGRLSADPSTGVVLVDGVPRGHRSGAYTRVYCDGTNLLAHRVVWIIVHGEVPTGCVINHRDGNGRNNRLSNLEAISQRRNVLHGLRDSRYVGLFPDDVVDPDVVAKVVGLLARPDVRRGDILAVLGVRIEEEPDDLMQPGASGLRPRRFL